MKNHTTKEVNELLDEYYQYLRTITWGEFTESTIEQFKKDKGLLPTLEVGKWYKSEMGSLFSPYDNLKSGYGFSWIDNSWQSNIYINEGWTEATHEEVEQALTAETIKKGFKEGVRVKYFFNGSGLNKTANLDSYDMRKITHHIDPNTGLYSLWLGDKCVMRDGKWATIIEDKKEMTIDEIQKELGYDIKIVK